MTMTRTKIVLYNPRAVFFTMPLALLAVGSALDPARYDVRIIDGLFVRGSARLVGAVGDGLRFFQNGDVQAYVTAIVVGIAAILVVVEYLL